MDSEKTVVATGLSGLVGDSLCGENSKLRYEHLRLDGERVDICDSEMVEKAIQATSSEIVLHLAAFTDVTAAWKQLGDQAGDCYRINVTGTRNVARSCARAGKYMIHVSTDMVFAGDTQERYEETTPTDATDWYGFTKKIAEEEVLAAGTEAAITRLSYPFGRSALRQKKDLVWKIVERLQGGQTVALFGDTVITPTYLPDFARCIESLAAKRMPGVFHTTGSTSLSPYALGGKLADATRSDRTSVIETSYSEYAAAGNRPYPRYLGLNNDYTVTELEVAMRTLPQALQDLAL